MKKSIKMIIMDLDGTLLMDDDKSVSEGNLAALKKARENQICIVAATGRSYVTVPDSVKQMQDLSYIVTSNGAVVTENCSQNSESV